jgi:TolB protein
MLTRVFRLNDKLSNAFLKMTVWLSQWLLLQVTNFRKSVEESVVALYRGTVQTVDSVTQSGRKAYGATDTKRRALMAHRAAMIQTEDGRLQPAIIEDPLVRQNRTLSVFTVLLMVALIAVVLWATSQNPNTGTRTAGGSGLGGILPQNTLPATAIDFPTPIPSATPVPQPLNWRGTLVYSARDNGQEDLFAIQRGDSAPKRLTNTSADDRDPAWSPDGRTLAFVTNRDGAWELYLMDIIDKQTRRLTFSPSYVGSPAWSPDGEFLVYEAYLNNNLDLYILSIDQTGPCAEPCQVTSQPGPDFEPAWMPVRPDGTGGRLIAYSSIRGATQDIFIIDLDNPNDAAAVNLTNTPNVDESRPAWSPDGRRIAYTARTGNSDITGDVVEGIYYREVDNPGTEFAVGRGFSPAWNPLDGSSLFYAARRGLNQSQIIGADPNILGGGGDVQIINGVVSDLVWSAAEPVFAGVEASYQPLYTELSEAQADNLYLLAELTGVNTIDAFLSTRVDDSFNALREQTRLKTGIDYLGQLDDAFWRLDRLPEPSQPRENWHYAGRAFALDRNLVLQGNPTPIVVVREERGIQVFWRVYLRVSEDAQNGRLGEPLRQIPWDFASRTTGDDLEAYERGGKRMDTIPAGYYVDFTQLAQDFGWEPLPSDRAWRQNFSGILFWDFVKTDQLSWRVAMRELYTEAELEALGRPVVDATATLPVRPTATPTEVPFFTPTPIPPDQAQ